MNKKLLLALLLACSLTSFAQQNEVRLNAVPAAPAPATIQFKVDDYDFGKIPQNKPVFYSFEFVNKGSVPVTLQSVTASCGCTTPEWSKDPVPPGGTATIRVGYNAASDGPFEKMINVSTTGGQGYVLKVRGNVWKAPNGSAPQNASLQFLKQQIQ